MNLYNQCSECKIKLTFFQLIKRKEYFLRYVLTKKKDVYDISTQQNENKSGKFHKRQSQNKKNYATSFFNVM